MEIAIFGLFRKVQQVIKRRKLEPNLSEVQNKPVKIFDTFLEKAKNKKIEYDEIKDLGNTSFWNDTNVKENKLIEENYEENKLVDEDDEINKLVDDDEKLPEENVGKNNEDNVKFLNELKNEKEAKDKLVKSLMKF